MVHNWQNLLKFLQGVQELLKVFHMGKPERFKYKGFDNFLWSARTFTKLLLLNKDNMVLAYFSWKQKFFVRKKSTKVGAYMLMRSTSWLSWNCAFINCAIQANFFLQITLCSYTHIYVAVYDSDPF